MKNKLILFQGDSVTDCDRSREETLPNRGLGSGYPMLVAARMTADRPADGLAFFNRGVSGNRVVDLYARWKIDALNLRPDVLSILIGVNDTWHEFARENGVEVERYEMVYRMLLEWTRRKLPETKLVLCEPFILEFEGSAPTTAWRGEMDRRREVVRKLSDEFGTVFIPFQKVVSDGAAAAGDPAAILGDGVHPTLTGHQLLADTWIAATGKLF